MNGEAPASRPRPRAPAVRPSSVPISFCWPPAQCSSGQVKDLAPGHQASARTKETTSAASGPAGGKAKERAETAWPPTRRDASDRSAQSAQQSAQQSGGMSEAQRLLSWKPCFEESFRVFNYIMTSDVAAAVAVAAQSAVVPLEATNRSKRRESREQRLSPWNLFSRTAPRTEEIGLLAGRKLPVPPRPATPPEEPARSSREAASKGKEAIEAEVTPQDSSQSASGAACRAAQNLGRQARPSSGLRRPPRQVKRSKSRDRNQMGVPHQVRCKSRGRLRGVQRQRALNRGKRRSSTTAARCHGPSQDSGHPSNFSCLPLRVILQYFFSITTLQWERSKWTRIASFAARVEGDQRFSSVTPAAFTATMQC